MIDFFQRNERRLELLNQRKTRFLTDDEVAELGWLTELVDAALPPRPRLSLEELQTALFAADKTIKALQEENAKYKTHLQVLVKALESSFGQYSLKRAALLAGVKI